MTLEAALLARVDNLLPAIAARASNADAQGAVADETIGELVDAGVFATLAPRIYGGTELSLHVFSSIVQKISAVSPSTGWVCAFLMGAAWRMLVFSEEAQREMYGGKNYLLGAGAAQPITGVEKVEGGYRLTGRTSWNSGASHAKWFSINGILKQESGPPDVMIFAVPRSQVTILDTWHILGMKGTASRDLEVNQVFVPNHRAARFLPALAGDSPGHAIHSNPMYHIPFIPFAMNEVLPVLVGTHRGAVQAYEARVRSRMGTFSGAKASDRVPMQIRLAHGLARAAMAEQMLDALVSQNMDARSDSKTPSSRAGIKLHASLVSTFCLDSVNELARGAGGDSFRDEADFQRYFRDINTVARHAFLDPETAGETFGKMMLNLPVADPLI